MIKARETVSWVTWGLYSNSRFGELKQVKADSRQIRALAGIIDGKRFKVRGAGLQDLLPSSFPAFEPTSIHAFVAFQHPGLRAFSD
jgi:hypothetical protein